MSKTLAKLQANNPDKIEEVWSEDNDGKDYWVALKPGWICGEVHTIHEWKVSDVLAQFKGVARCDMGEDGGLCEECVKMMKKLTR